MDQANAAQFEESIAALPKFRVKEITARVNEVIAPGIENANREPVMNKTMQPSAMAKMAQDQNSNAAADDKSADAAQKDKPKFAKSFTDRIGSTRDGNGSQPGSEQVSGNNFEELLNVNHI